MTLHYINGTTVPVTKAMPVLRTVIDFKRNLIEPQNLDLLDIRLFKMDRRIFIELKGSNLYAHPPVIYDRYSNWLDVSFAPFIVVDAHGHLTLYSIASEHLPNPYYTISCSNCKVLPLDTSSILIVDAVTNKATKIVEVSIDRGIDFVDIGSIDIDARYVHSMVDHAIYISEDKTVYKIRAAGRGVDFEPIERCERLYYNDRYHRTSLCIYDSSSPKVFINSRIYGTAFELDDFDNHNSIRYIDGYIANNIGFIEINKEKVYISDLKSMSSMCVAHRFRPLSLLSNGSILGIAEESIAILYSIADRVVKKVARIDPSRLKDFDVNEDSGTSLVVYDNSVYIFNFADDPVYLKLKAGDVYSATLVDTFLLVFRRSSIDVYGIDLDYSSIHLEKLKSMPKYFIKCRALTGREIICVDVLGRLIIDRAENIVLEHDMKIVPLMNTYGRSMYLQGYCTALLLDRNFASINLQRIDSFSVITTGDSADDVDTSIHRRWSSEYLDETEHHSPLNIRYTPIADKFLVIDRQVITLNTDPTATPSFLTILLGTEHVERRLGFNTASSKEFAKLLEEGYTVFLSSKNSVGEHGFAISRSNIEVVNANDILKIENGFTCVLEGFNKLKNILNFVKLIVLCSNTLLEQKDSACINLDGCERLLQFIVVFNVNGKRRHIIIPVPDLLDFRSDLDDLGDKVRVRYMYGQPYILLPRKCIDISSTKLILDDKPSLELNIANQCQNVGATIVVDGGTVEYLEPGTKKRFKIDLDVHYLVALSPIQLIVYESVGRVSRYMISITLHDIIRKAYANALKLSKILGIRNDHRLRYNVPQYG